jgi:hypothetical protein
VSSSVDAEYTAIVTQWRANCPVVEARRCYTQLGGPPFNRPQISLTAITNSNRSATCAALVWVALSITGSPRSGRQICLDPTTGHTHREGNVYQQIFFPDGFGLDFVLPIVDTARGVFHRDSLASGVVRFRDSDAPIRIHTPEFAEAGWGQFNVVTPYYVREVI